MLEEGLSRAEHEAGVKGGALREALANGAAREEGATTELRAAAAVAAELNGEVARLREKADKAGKARIVAQGEVARVTGEAAEASARAAARFSALEEQVASLQATVRTLSSTIDGMADNAASQGAALEAATTALGVARAERAAVVAEAERASEAAASSLAAYGGHVTTLTAGLKALDKQLKSTQALLAVVKEQKGALAEANAALRAELDEQIASSLAGLTEEVA
jgi:chromosome segregation ATPase